MEGKLVQLLPGELCDKVRQSSDASPMDQLSEQLYNLARDNIWPAYVLNCKFIAYSYMYTVCSYIYSIFAHVYCI